MNNLLESESLTKQNKNLRLQLLKGLFGPWKGDKEATDGFVCVYRTRQRTTFKLVLNQSSYLCSVGVWAVWFVTWMERSGVQGSGQKNWAVSFPDTKVSTEDQTWMSAVCSVTAQWRQASCYHVTWPLLERISKDPGVTSIILSPSSCYFYGVFVFPSQLDCSHCWLLILRLLFSVSLLGLCDSWLQFQCADFFRTRLSDSLTPAPCPTVQLNLTVCTWRECEIL